MSQLFPIPLINPAVRGLNTAQQGNSLLGPEWAAAANNCFFDNSQRLAARQGWVAQSLTPIGGSPAVEQTFEFVQSTGNTVVLSVANNHIYSGVTSYTDITGTASTSGTSNWQLLNFNDVCIGVQDNLTPIFWTGSSNFAPITPASGTLPTGNCGCAAFGRLWIADHDGHTIKYCKLGDYTNWSGADTGSIDMRQVWTDGTDTIVGIYAFFARLVVFGQKHIVTWVDGTGSSIGLNPSTMVVADTIEGTGLVSRDTVQMIAGGDMVYLSPNGVQSLQRAIVQKNNPIGTLDTQVKDYLNGFLGSENLLKVRSVFDSTDRCYLLILPVNNLVFCYDTLFPMQDGRLRVTQWTYLNGGPKCAVYRRSNAGLLLGFPGVLGLYNGYTDNGNSYLFQWWSSVFSGGSLQLPQGQTLENREKILKRLNYVIYSQQVQSPVIKWGYDFNGLLYSAVPTLMSGEIPEYGTAEYGTNGVYNNTLSGLTAGVDISQYSGQLVINTGHTPGASAGRWLQVGVEATISGGAFAIQELDALVKIGRMT